MNQFKVTAVINWIKETVPNHTLTVLPRRVYIGSILPGSIQAIHSPPYPQISPLQTCP